MATTRYETPPDYEQIISKSTYMLPGEIKRTHTNSNHYYPDNSTRRDIFNTTEHDKSIEYYYSSGETPINTLNAPLEPLQYDPYSMDHYFIAKCITCNKSFTRYEKKKGTSHYVNCNNCRSHYKEDDNSSCAKCFKQCTIM